MCYPQPPPPSSHLPLFHLFRHPSKFQLQFPVIHSIFRILFLSVDLISSQNWLHVMNVLPSPLSIPPQSLSLSPSFKTSITTSYNRTLIPFIFRVLFPSVDLISSQTRLHVVNVLLSRPKFDLALGQPIADHTKAKLTITCTDQPMPALICSQMTIGVSGIRTKNHNFLQFLLNSLHENLI